MNQLLPKHITNPDPNIYFSKNYIVLDFETTNIDHGNPLVKDNRVIMWSMLIENVMHSRFGDGYYDPLLQRVNEADFIIAHNAKFELQWLDRLGIIDLTKVVVWDTMIAEYVLCGNRKMPLDADSVAKRHKVGGKVSLVSKMIKAGICPSEIPRRWLLPYCEQDVKITHDVFRKQLESCNKRGLLATVYTRCLLTPVLADIEPNGMCLDHDRVVDELTKTRNELNFIEQELSKYDEGINWNSGPQRAEFIYDKLGFKELTNRRHEPIRTPKGGRKTDADTIIALRPANKRQASFLDIYKNRSKIQAALSKNLEFFLGVVKERDGGIFQASFNQCRTVTHRLSSSGKKQRFRLFPKDKSVQFQNFPRKYKRLFTARNPGWKIGEVDGAQLEFRTAAFLGRCAAALKAIIEGFDVHKFTASILNRCRLEDVTKAQRQDAKPDTFKPLYGGQSGTDRQQEYYAAFRTSYPGIAAAQQAWLDEVLSTKKLVTETGLIFYWPDTKVTSSGYVTNTTNIYNAPVQSLATAEVIPISVVYQWHRMKVAKLKSFIVNTVHDSTIGEIHPKEEKIYAEIAKVAFTKDVYEYLDRVYNVKWCIPLGVEVKIGDYWGEGEEQKYDLAPPYTLTGEAA